MDESVITHAEGLPAYRLPPCVQNLLRFLYPTINWRTVAFFNDIPWWLEVTGWDANAITLPDTFTNQIYVFFNSKKLARPSASHTELVYPNDLNALCRPGQSTHLVATLIHECVHVLQFQQADSSSIPLGYLRPSTTDYLKCWACHGFVYDDQLPHEKEAYDQERQFTACASSLGLDNAVWCCVPQPSAADPLKHFMTSACGQALVKMQSVRTQCCDNALAGLGSSILAAGVGVLVTAAKIVLILVTPIVEFFSDLFNSTEDDKVRDDIRSASGSNLAARSDADLIDMVQKLFDGPTGDDDENAVLRLLSCLPCPRVATLVGSFGVQNFLDEFQGAEYGHLQLLLLNCGVLSLSSLDDNGVCALVKAAGCAGISGASVSVLHGLFLQLLSGYTDDEDEQTINAMMGCLSATTIRTVLRMNGTRWDDFDSAIQGDEWDDFVDVMKAKGIPEP